MVSDFAKEKVFWSKSMNISLAQFMEHKPHMWDPKNPQNMNLGLRDETFAEFAAQYQNGFSWQAVKDRWTNVRSTYGFYMRKLQARKAKGENFQVNWFMWEPCKYLFQVYKSADKKADSTVSNSKKRKNSEFPENGNGGEVNGGIENQAHNSSGDEANYDDTNYNITNDSNVSCEEIVDNIVTVFKGVQNNAFGVDSSKYASIGQAVTDKLSRLNSYDAAQLSQKILEVLADYDENNPMNPNNS